MNPLNYATLEASKRLIDAGIVLETESVWIDTITNRWMWVLKKDVKHYTPCREDIPAPSMAEVWRELPEWATIRKIAGTPVCWVEDAPKYGADPFARINPTDALIDLLIWVRSQKP